MCIGETASASNVLQAVDESHAPRYSTAQMRTLRLLPVIILAGSDNECYEIYKTANAGFPDFAHPASGSRFAHEVGCCHRACLRSYNSISTSPLNLLPTRSLVFHLYHAPSPTSQSARLIWQRYQLSEHFARSSRATRSTALRNHLQHGDDF